MIDRLLLTWVSAATNRLGRSLARASESECTLVGTIGHVAHGKSTVVKAISGVLTVRFKNELERNITIKLGYANAKVSQCISGPNAYARACSRYLGA